jgi:hypothetical protein
MEEDEITRIRTDDRYTITHVGSIKGSTQPISIIIHLMHHEGYSFYTLKDGMRKEVYHKSSVDGKAFLTVDPDSSLVDSLKFLPEC